MQKYICRSAILVLIFIGITANAQQAIRYFEPGISITYDTAIVRAYQRDYSTFRIKAEQTEIKVSSEMPFNENGRISKIPTTFSELQAYVQNQVEKLNKQPGSFSFTGLDVVDYDKKVKKISGFLGYGFIELNKQTNKKYTTIFIFHISENAYTRGYLKSFENKSLAHHYNQLEIFLKGFKSYSKKELADLISQNEKKYTIVVRETKEVLPQFKKRTGEYLAVVTTKEKLENSIKEVFINRDKEGISEVFKPNEKGEVYIACRSNKKGLIEQKAIFVFISSFGKEIYIPFTIKFEQK